MTDPWTPVDRSNLAIFIASETGRKLFEMALAPSARPKPAKTMEEYAISSANHFGFLSAFDWMEKLLVTAPEKVREVPYIMPEPEAGPGKSHNPY
jgi:hypothetical protein